VLGNDLTALDAIGLSAAATMVVLLVVRARSNLRELATAEPAAARE
jgi:hypothetical protein